MRTGLILLLLAIPAAGVRAQAPEPLRSRLLSSGVAVSLPDSWKPLDPAAQERLAHMVDTALQRNQDSVLKASLRNGRPLTLLMEVNPVDPQANVSVNAAPAPGTTPNAFAAIPPEQVAAALAPICNALRSMAAQAGSQTISCGPTRLTAVSGRTIALTEMVRTGPKGFVAVRLAQFPVQDAVYTLTLTSPQTEDARYQRLFVTMYQSVRLSP